MPVEAGLGDDDAIRPVHGREYYAGASPLPLLGPLSTNLPRVRNVRRMRALVVTGLVGLVVAGAVVFFVVQFASQRPDEVNLGRDRFQVGRPDVFAKAIRRDGPILFKDPLTSKPGREIYVQHLGADDTKGWFAIDAYAADAPREERCILEWRADRRVFADPCGDTVIAADGAGVRRYPGEVDARGALIVDLRTRAVG